MPKFSLIEKLLSKLWIGNLLDNVLQCFRLKLDQIIRNIVENEKLKELLQKGPKYREPENINWEEIKISLNQSLDESIKEWGEKVGLDTEYFTQWKINVMQS